MPRSYWMVVQTPENHEITKGQGFRLHGLSSRQRRRALRMEPEDRILFYVGGSVRKWTAIADVTSKYFEDNAPIWKSNGSRPEVFPYRVKISPSIVLDEADYIDAHTLAPRMEYLKRWPPELWPLAFFDTLHLLPQRDFRLIETEMKRVRRTRRGRPWEDRREWRDGPRRNEQSQDDGVEDIREETDSHDTEDADLDMTDGSVSAESSQTSSDSSSDG